MWVVLGSLVTVVFLITPKTNAEIFIAISLTLSISRQLEGSGMVHIYMRAFTFPPI